MPISAKVIKHTCSGETQLITVEVEFHRFILPELNTHRCFSRSYQSSRAVPIEKMIEQVRNDPALPVYWGKNKKGMQADEELVDTKHIQWRWHLSAKSAADEAEYLVEQGLHKQLTNRLLEPFMWTKGVITATKDGWNSFFKLRIHPDAQPEIKALADEIKKAIDNSHCEVLSKGEWHLPYVDDISKFASLEDAIKVSVSCCAQVSYRTLDDSLDKAEKIYDMLNLPSKGVFSEEPAHMSPCEHIAMATSECYNGYDLGLIYSPTEVGGNFNTFDYFQYRKALESGDECALITSS